MIQRRLSFFGHLVNVGVVRFVACRTLASGRTVSHAPPNRFLLKMRRYRFSRSRVMRRCVNCLAEYTSSGMLGLCYERDLIGSVRVLLGLVLLSMDAADTSISTFWQMVISPDDGSRITLEPVDWVIWLMSNRSAMWDWLSIT